MPAQELGRLPSADKLLHQLNLHLEEVQETYDRVIHAQQPLYYSTAAPQQDRSPEPVFTEPLSSNLVRFLDQRAPNLAAVLKSRPLIRAAHSFEAFLERVNSNDSQLRALNDHPALAQDVVDVFENSAHFAEELIRRPELIEDLARMRDDVGPHIASCLLPFATPRLCGVSSDARCFASRRKASALERQSSKHWSEHPISPTR